VIGEDIPFLFLSYLRLAVNNALEAKRGERKEVQDGNAKVKWSLDSRHFQAMVYLFLSPFSFTILILLSCLLDWREGNMRIKEKKGKGDG